MKTILGFHIPTTARHWVYALATTFIGAAAGAIQSHGNWHESVLTGVLAVAGFLKVYPLPASGATPQPATPEKTQ